jgi:hypothetical protein
MTASAAAASNELKAGGDRSFLVEHIERRQADVGDFFLTEREFVARLYMPRRDIRGGASRLRRYARPDRTWAFGIRGKPVDIRFVIMPSMQTATS